jgi:hypothetical protein
MSVLPITQRRDRIKLIDQGIPRAQVVLGAHAERHVVLRHVHPAVVLEDGDAPILIGIGVGLFTRTDRDVLRDEMAQVAIDVLPRREMSQPSARGAAIFDLLTAVFRIDQDDGEIVDGDQSLFSKR